VDEIGDYHLTSLVDDNGKVSVSSDVYSRKGEKKDKTKKMVSDYGIASVLVYKEENKTTELKGKYVQEDYYDTKTCTVKQKTINESFSINISSSVENVITHAVTISGAVNYTYEPDETLTTAVQSGETEDETQNVKKVLYDTKTVTTYKAKSGGIQKSFSSKIAMENYCNAHKDYAPITDSEGNYKTYTKSYKLYKYRSDDSGIYTTFVKKADSTTSEEDTTYLYDYLKNFSTYMPIIDRTNNVFLSISSGATVSNLKTASLSVDDTLGEGANDFEMFYNGGKKEVIERIWDMCITWGYSEEQTSAILGNITQESSFETTINDDSGAYGLCQFMKERLTGLKKFASEYKKTDPSDLDTQIQYMLLELQGGDGTYAGDGWSHTDDRKEDYENFTTSDDIEVLTRAMCHGFERPNEKYAMYQKRINCAYSAYKLLHGRTVETGNEVLLTDLTDGDSEDSDGTTTVTLKYSSGTMSDEDKETFSNFYHAVDDIYSGDMKIKLYKNPLTTEDADLVIKTANAFINQTTLSQAQLTIDNQMWSKGYISSVADMEAKVDEDTDSSSDMIAGEDEYLLPVAGKHIITSEYGYRTSPTAGASSNHKGVDIGATYGEGIYCAKDGVVTFAGWGNSGGYYIMVDHGNGVTTMYLHNSKLLVKTGDKVKQGQKIALAGSTGVSTGTHCHISVFLNGVYQNPHDYFDFSKLSED
jgi:murein DD-endopeptidase MepM/ murein hydrolase activator NlpD